MVPMEVVCRNAITPAGFLHIISGVKAKYVLPDDHPTYIRGKPCGNQPPYWKIERLHAVGIFHTKGLTDKQTDFLLELIKSRAERDLAAPWQLKALSKNKRMTIASKNLCFASVTKYEAEMILSRQ